MRITSVGRALPEHHYDQDALLAALAKLWAGRFHNPKRLEQIQRNTLVGGRYLALRVEEYEALRGFGAANAAFLRCGLELGIRRACWSSA